MRIIVTCFLIALTIPSFVQAVEFTPLGLQGVLSVARDISADGTVVVGDSPDGVFRWTRESGLVGIADGEAQAGGVNEDGSVIVGTGGESSKAFRWTEPTGPVELGGYPEHRSWANDVNADGTVVVGGGQSIQFGDPGGFRWTQQTGSVNIGSGEPSGISADGTVIVGATGGASASRWTQATGWVGLGKLPGQSSGRVFSGASSISADGTTIVGSSIDEDTEVRKAFRWTQATGMVALEAFSQSDASARDVNANGSVIVGNVDDIAFIWKQDTGMLSIQELLTNEGVSLVGWSLQNAIGVSADGMVVVGNGINPDGLMRAWLADLSGLPDEDLPDLPDKINPAVLLILLRGSDDQFGEEEN